MLEGRDEIRDLFSEKLNSFETEVRPEVWSKISSQIGTTAATSAGISIALKVVIASTVAASIVGAVYLINRNSEKAEVINSTSVQEDSLKNANSEVVSKLPDNSEEEILTPILNHDIKGSDNTTLKNSPKSDVDYTLTKIHIPENNSIIDKPSVVSEEKIVEKVEENIVAVPAEKNPDPVVEEFERKEEVKADYVLNLPNIFTPNGDGSNDILSIKSENLSELNVVILDQNNRVVFSTDNPDFRWDGTTLSGVSVPSGNYVYYVTGKDTNGKFISKYSLLTITR